MKTIYIEGTTDTDNGNLREAFARLFEQELKGNMPRIIMGDGKNQTIDKFHGTPLKKEEKRFLLFDSDEPNPDKTKVCAVFNAAKPNRKIDATEENTFLMIQEVEAWLLSQPQVLTAVGIEMSKFSIADVESIRKPSEKLAELYKHSGKIYSKVSEFVKVFPYLNSSQLKQSSSEYKAMIEGLKK